MVPKSIFQIDLAGRLGAKHRRRYPCLRLVESCNFMLDWLRFYVFMWVALIGGQGVLIVVNSTTGRVNKFDLVCVE